MLNKDEQKKLIEKILEYKNIIIAKHIGPDWDAVGSAEGLKEIIVSNFNDKNVFIVGSTIDNNDIYKNENLDMETIQNSLLITVDVANSPRIDFEEWNQCKEIFKIDHHIKVDNFGHYELIDEKAIACTQVIALWAGENNLKINEKASKFLYKGLITDSGRFLFRNTSENTFEAAKILVRSGVKITDVYDELYLKDFKIAKWHNFAFSKIQMYKDSPIGYITLKREEFIEWNLLDEEVKSALGVMSGIKEIEIWLLIHEDKLEDKIKVSIRSRKYNINKVAVLYNGGGHGLASGAKLDDWNQLNDLLNDLEKLVKDEDTYNNG